RRSARSSDAGRERRGGRENRSDAASSDRPRRPRNRKRTRGGKPIPPAED
ncbi:hypothetical protein HMPREF1318_2962, partial [Actinomyces massiliensis F0489]